MLHIWLAPWRKRRNDRSGPTRRRLRPARLEVEVLEDRLAPANLAMTNALVVDVNNNPLPSVVAGDWVYIQADFTTQDLPAGASYRVAFMVNGLTVDSAYVNWGAGMSGTGYWDYYIGTFIATPGANDVTITVDPDRSVLETTNADNTYRFAFNAAQPVPGTFLSYTAAQMRNAYGLNSIPGYNGVKLGITPNSGTPNGAGQTIAIINGGNDPSLFADVNGWDQVMSLTTTSAQTLYQQYGPASSFLTVYNQYGVNITANLAHSGSYGVPPLPSGGEESWDVEWAHAMAPGARIDEIEFDPTGAWGTNLLTAYATAGKLPGVSVANWCGGLSQWSDESTDDSAIFVTPTGASGISVTPTGHTGVTYICPSNDNGANVYPQYGQGDGYYPSTSPNVLSVGGTSLIVNNNGYGSETGWSFPTPTTTIANSSSNFSESGSWGSQVGGFTGSYSTAPRGTGSTATWTIPVTFANTGWGTELSATWTANAANATNATYTVYDGAPAGGNVLGTVTIDQTKAPVGTADGHSKFQELGVFFPTLDANGNGTVTVLLDATSANGTLVADTVGAASAWASTGGPAYFESEPAYQTPFQSTGYRTTPDVSFDADWSGDGFSGGGVTYGGGGTSLGGPCWAGLIAVINQGLVRAGGRTLNSPSDPTQTLQALYSLPASDFNQITTGYNGFSAGPGYNFVTGRGSPIAPALVPDMISYVLGPGRLTFSTEPAASVIAGQPFGVTVQVENAYGTTDPFYNGPVTISLASGPLGVSLAGTVTATAVNGVADFTNLILPKAGTYSLSASAHGCTTTSTSFTAVPGDANIAITNALVVDGNANPLNSVTAGQQVFIEGDFTTLDLPAGASYRVAFTVNGVSLASGYITWGAGATGTGFWFVYWGTFTARAGTNYVTVTVDPDESVAETSYADNIFNFTFTALAPGGLP
jgi:subtilase family serine protease